MKLVVKILKAEKELINSPDKWTKGAYCRDKNNRTVPLSSPMVVCRCQAGASSEIEHRMKYDHMLHRDVMAIKNSIAFNLRTLSAIDYNDAAETSHADMMNFYDMCIDLAEKEY